MMALWLLKMARPLWLWLAAAVLLGVGTVLSSVGLMGAAAFIIASAALHPSIAALQVAIVGVRFFGISRALLRYSERLVAHRATLWQLANLRAWFYARLEPLAPAQLQDMRSGDLLARLIGDVDSLQDFFVRVLAPSAAAIGVGGLTGFFISRFSLRLSVVFLLVYSVAGLVLPLLLLRLGRQAEQQQAELASQQRVSSVDLVQGLGDLLLSGQGARLVAQDFAQSQDRDRWQSRALRISGAEIAGISLLSLAAMLAMIALGTPLVRAQALSGVQLTVLALVALASFEAVQALPSAVQTWTVQRRAAQRLVQLSQTPVWVRDQPGATSPALAKPLAPDDVLLDIRGLHFSYPETAAPVLQDINLQICGTQKVAIVGPSGSGKSSLLALILRFWVPQQGELRLWGKSLDAYQQDSLRQSLGVLGQGSYIFSGRLIDNLSLGGCQDRSLMTEALRQAQLWDFVKTLPQGLDTWIGEQGMQLSGGQRQRLALARALLGDPKLLILDEPSAHLDVETEKALFLTLHKVAAPRAMLCITHRLVNMQLFDNILVLKQGRIVEQGSHASLLAQNASYAQLWRAQERQLG